MATSNTLNTAMPINVSDGGIGAATLLDHGVLVGSGTAAVTPLAVGATGQYLSGVTDGDPAWTSTTPLSGAFSFVSRTTVSTAVSTIEFTDLDEAGASYMFIFEGISCVEQNTNFQSYLSTDNGSNWLTATNYVVAGYSLATITSTPTQFTGETYIRLTLYKEMGQDPECALTGQLLLISPQNSNYWKTGEYQIGYREWLHDGAEYTRVWGDFKYATSTAVDAIKFQMGDGNIDAGNITCYKLSGS